MNLALPRDPRRVERAPDRTSRARGRGERGAWRGRILSAAVEPENGEQVFFHGHPSWLSMLFFYVKGVLGAVLLGALAGVLSALISGHVEAAWIALAVLVVFALVALSGFIRLITTTYTVTDQRLTIETGLLSRNVHHTRLARVQNVNSRQSLFERMLGIGTVDFDTAGEQGFNFSFDGVAHPHGIVHTVDRALRETQQTGGL
jgi:uncharacterized membrane protein YdbT with pleckstrin-like domain